jgi:hypothetical protein
MLRSAANDLQGRMWFLIPVDAKALHRRRCGFGPVTQAVTRLPRAARNVSERAWFTRSINT